MAKMTGQEPMFAFSLPSANLSSVPPLNLAINDTTDQVINGTEAPSVAFAVSGLTVGETGTVTFSDAASHQVVVNVNANGSYSANLSALDDGTVSSTLVATGPGNATTSVAGNPITLDTDSDLTPTLTVNATNPANVTFTVG